MSDETCPHGRTRLCYDCSYQELYREAEEENKMLRFNLAELLAFVRSLTTDWDCDTGANDSHHYLCRACEAAKFTRPS
jgi:hypothetical protein